jgi:gas vesicle protein
MRYPAFLSVSLLAAAALVTTTTVAGAQSTTEKVQQRAEDTKEKVKGTAEDTKDKVKDTARDTKDKIKDTAQDTKDKAEEKGHAVVDKMRDMKDKVKAKLHRKTEPSTSMRSGSGSADIRMVQQSLKDSGYDPGPVDGVQGPHTTAALKAYQKAQGLQETGQADSDTMAKLGVSAGAAGGPAEKKVQSR